jgi:uncharacterized membrane protein
MAAKNSAVSGALAQGAKGLAQVAGKRLLSSVSDKIGDTTERLTEYTANGGGPGLLSAIRGGNGQKDGGQKGSSKSSSLKVTNILEEIDIGAPVRLVYDQWTQFADFPTFMKKVESVEQEEDQKLRWKAQVLWSHRTWESTIVEQVPDKRIVWQSEGEKASVDGAVTFHELAPDLTRVCLVMEYHPQGFFERTGNIWRAQGRRVRLELKHFARHVMTEAILHRDEVEGWRGEIHDGEVTKDAEQARADEEQPESDETPTGSRQPEDQGDGGQGDRQGDRPRGGQGEGPRRGRERAESGPRRRSADEDRPARRPARGQRSDERRSVGGGRE